MRYFAVVIVVCCLALIACDPKTKGPTTESGNNTAQVDTVLEALNQKILNDPNNFQNYLDRAKYYGSKQDYAMAFQDLDRAVVADSTKGDIYLYKGELFWSQQKIKEAYEEFKTCLHFDATHKDCLLKKATVDIALKNYELAMQHINDALKSDDHMAEAYFLKGKLYGIMGDTTLSASSLQTAIEVDPNYYNAYIELGLLYAARKHDLAKEYYNSAIDLKPRSIEAWYDKAMFLQETGPKDNNRFSEAFACYDTILHIDPNFAGAHFNKGFIHLVYQQKYEDGILEFTNAIGAFPGYYQAYYNRGLCYERIGRTRDAETDFRKSLQIKPDYSEAALGLSRILGEKN
jgi:tetratricopeptide (TPR) repeat protein